MNELYHHGVPGMKWGVRRYQNKDGTLTSAGRRRYDRDASDNNWKKGSDGNYVGTGKNNKGQVQKANPNKWVKEDLERSKRVVDSSSNMTNQLKTANKNALKRERDKNATKMDLSKMTDKEMRDQINRAMLERQYADMFADQSTTRGRQYVDKALDSVGGALAVTSSALAIALAIKELKG